MYSMNLIIPVVIAGVILCAAVVIFFATSSKGGGGKSLSTDKKNRSVIVKSAEKRLKQDPQDPRGLLPLVEIYFQEQSWEKALGLYKTIIEIAPLHQIINVKEASWKAGVCALKINDLDYAFKALSLARTEDPENFETNFYLGQAFFNNKQFDKALPLFNKAYIINKDNNQLHEYLGLCFYEIKDYRKAFPLLKASFDVNPDNKKVLFAMAESLYYCNKGDKAISVFLHLRADPEFGARACLYSGLYHASKKQMDKAIKDFEIGLKHESAPLDIITNIRYNLSQAYLGSKNIPKALSLLKDIQATNPGYKDVQSLVARYHEMSQNSSLQTYLVAGSSDFLALCRNIVSSYFAKSHVKIIALDAKPDVVEIQTEIETAKWEDFVVFRFYRSTGATGEFVIRDFHGRIRDVKAGRGICFTAGAFSSEAKKFVDGRPIDLIDKEGLLKVFIKLAQSRPITQ